MSKGPRVGDIGTEIILHITEAENGEPVKLGGASATIEIVRPGGVDIYPAIVEAEEATVKYEGKITDNLWPSGGVYIMRGIVRWPDGRKFMTEDAEVRVK